MARTAIQNPHFRTTGDVEVQSGRQPVILGWYEFSAEFCRGKRVLDVGCGMGEGLEILATTAEYATGIDLDERLRRPNVRITDISNVESKSVDIVTCIDVIEHVEDDLDFAQELARVAREDILVSTPNWTISRCDWPYHVREYMPHQLARIFRPFGKLCMYKGSFDGKRRYKVEYPGAFSLLNILRVNPLTGFATRICNHVFPVSARLQASLFVHVNMGTR